MNKLLPHWEQIREAHPLAHIGLQSVAGAIYDRIEKSAPLVNVLEVDLGPALDLGFLVTEEEKVTIPNEVILQEYLVRHATDAVALPAWDDLEGFARAFDDIQHRSTRLEMRQETANGVLLVLAREFDKDLLSRIAEAARWAITGEERIWLFWSIYSPFCEVLPQLDVSPAALARDLEPVLQASQHDFFGGSVYDAVEKLAQRSRAMSEDLFDAFTACPDSPVVALAANALVSLATFDLKYAHGKALALLSSEQFTLRRVGINSLGRFDYEDEDIEILQETFARFERLLGMPNIELDYVLVRAYGDLLPYAEEETSKALVEFAKRSDPAVRNQLSLVLFRNDDAAYDKPWFQEALLLLADVPSSHTETLRNLDYCATKCVRDFPQVALTFMEKLVNSRDYGREGRSFILPDMLQGTYAALCAHYPEQLADTVTRWFASDKPGLHRAATHLVQHRAYAPRGDSRPVFTLSKAVLDTLDEQTIVYLLTRIMGYVTNCRVLTALLVSGLQCDPCPQPLATFVAEALSEYVLYNYPGEAGEYLESRLSGAKHDSNHVEQQVIRAALARSDGYYLARRQLPVAKELQPPSNHVYLLRLAQQKQHASLMDETNMRSPLLSLVQKVPLKYGRAFFTEVEGAFTEPSRLGSISTQWEPPRGEFIDPLGQAYQRMEWQYAGLSELSGGVEQNEHERSDT